MPDPARLAAIHGASFTTPRPWSAPEIAALLSGPGVFLIEEPGGFVIGRAVLDEAELLTIAVAPEARRRGLGARLLAGFEARAVALGASHGFLEVAAGNAPALALYHAGGWTEAGRRKGYYRDPQGAAVDALVLQRTFARHGA